MRCTTAAAAAALLVLSACSGTGGGSAERAATSSGSDAPPASGAPPATVDLSDEGLELIALSTFDACDALLDHLRTEGAERVGPYGLDGSPWQDPFLVAEEGDFDVEVETEALATSADDSAGAAAAGADAARREPVEGVDFSGTNLAELGVDEPDVVKTDGERILVVSGGELVVIDVAARAVTGRVDVADGWSPELLLDGDDVIVVTRTDGETLAASSDVSSASDIARPGSFRPTTRIERISLAGPSPIVSGTLEVEGDYVSARAVDGTARIVVRSAPGGELPFLQPSSANAEQAAMEANQAVIASSELDDWLPGYTRRDAGGAVVGEGLLTPCDRVHAPASFAGFGVLSVVSLPVAGDLTPSTTSVLAPGDIVSAFPTSMYVATTSWPESGPRPIEGDAAEEAWDERATDIHRFELSGTDATYTASGEVPGVVRDLFSMSEHEGVLRVVTTSGDPWDETSESFVRTMRQAEGRLVELASVGDLGNGEAVQSVRFVGDTAYVVTFRQVDPFYTVDLSDPAAPRVVGELKIPGFSSYLHPIGEGRVIGVGSTADEQTGMVTGAKVSLYDVTDPANPVEEATWDAPDGWNEVGFEHRAFLWWEPERLAVVPLQLWNEGWAGAVVLRVEPGSITEVGRIDHLDAAAEQITCDELGPADVGAEDPATVNSELQYMVTDGGQAFICGQGEDVSVSRFSCDDDPWLGEEAERVGLTLAPDERIVACWPEEAARSIVRSLVVGGDELWTLSYQYGDPSQPALLRANAIADLAPLATVQP